MYTISEENKTERYNELILKLSIENPDILEYNDKASLKTMVYGMVDSETNDIASMVSAGVSLIEAKVEAAKNMYFVTPYSKLNDFIRDRYNVDTTDKVYMGTVLSIASMYVPYLQENDTFTDKTLLMQIEMAFGKKENIVH